MDDAARCREAAAAGNLALLRQLVTDNWDLQKESGSLALVAARAGQTWAVNVLEQASGGEWLYWDAGPMCEELLRKLTPPQPSLPWASAVFAVSADSDLRLQLTWIMDFYSGMFWPHPVAIAARNGHHRTHWFLDNRALYIPGLWEAASGDLQGLLAVENVDMTEACMTAAGHGQLNLLKDLHARKLMPLDMDLVTTAALHGHIVMLRWMMSLARCDWSLETGCAAVQAPGAGGLAVAAHLTALKPKLMLSCSVLEDASMYATDAVFHWLFSQPGAKLGAEAGMCVAEGTAACRLRWLAREGWALTEQQQRRVEELQAREAAMRTVLARAKRGRRACIADVPGDVLSVIFKAAGLSTLRAPDSCWA